MYDLSQNEKKLNFRLFYILDSFVFMLYRYKKNQKGKEQNKNNKTNRKNKLFASYYL